MRYYLIAGEASGDLHGANLMRALKKADPSAEFRFWGGDAMAEVAGHEPARHIRDLAIMGFVEVVMHLRTVLGNIAFCKNDIADYCPRIIVGIDYPGFNLKIEKWARQHGFLVIHYISPNLWAWKKGRIKGMRRTLDRLCYILPFEQEFYAQNNFPQAVYVGHPLLDAIHNQQFSPNDQHTIALLPGSRRQELKKVLPSMLRLADRHPEYNFVIAGMSLIGDNFYQKLIARYRQSHPDGAANVRIVYDQTYPLLSQSHAAVVCSGTATLETALFNVPQVVCYKANPISIAIARQLVGKRIKYISLVNLILDAPVVTELIQQDLSDERLEEEFRRITDDATRKPMLESYARLRTLLGNAGASDRTAREILNVISQPYPQP